MSIQHQELVKQYQSRIANRRTTLNLRDNDIGHKGVKALAAVLPNSSLTTLNLSYNDIGNEGTKALADALPNSLLTTLNLSYNDIRSEGAKALATALSQSSLTTLNLYRNDIGDKGAKALATALPNSLLTTLNLSYNHIGNEGVKALASALPNSLLITLDLGLNIFRYEWAKALAAGLPNSSLTTLNLRYNGIKNEGIQHLKETILTPDCRIYKTGINEIDKKLKPRKQKFLEAANELLLSHHIDENSFDHLTDDEKINLFFKIKDSQIKCHNQFMQHFMGKDGNCTRKIGAFLPIKELSQHVMSFVYPELSNQDITEAWAMTENKLSKITEKNNTTYEAIDTTQPTRMTG